MSNPDFAKPRKTLWWVRSLAEDVAYYRIDQSTDDGETWAELATVRVVPGQWDYQYTTGPLTDLATYTWRIVAADTAGSDSTAKQIGPEKVVRTPDAPDFDVAFDAGTRRVTFATSLDAVASLGTIRAGVIVCPGVASECAMISETP